MIVGNESKRPLQAASPITPAEAQSSGRFTSIVILHACILSCVCRDQAMPSTVTPYYTRQIFGLCLVSEDYFISRIGVHFEHKRRWGCFHALLGTPTPAPAQYHSGGTGWWLTLKVKRVPLCPIHLVKSTGTLWACALAYQNSIRRTGPMDYQIYQTNEERNSFTWVW